MKFQLEWFPRLIVHTTTFNSPMHAHTILSSSKNAMNRLWHQFHDHYCDAIMGTVESLITSLTIVYTAVYSDADQSKHQSSVSLAFVWGIHRGPVNSPHKWPVTRKMFPFDDVIMPAPQWLFRVMSLAIILLTFLPHLPWSQLGSNKYLQTHTDGLV